MPDVSHKEHPVDPGMASPAAQGPGNALDPNSGSVVPARDGPGDHLSPDSNFLPPRAPTGDHLDSWAESDTVQPVATRPSTGDHLTPDLP